MIRRHELLLVAVPMLLGYIVLLGYVMGVLP